MIAIYYRPRLTCVGLRSLVLLWRRLFGVFACRRRSSSATLADEPKPSEPAVQSSNENAVSFSESKLISNPESEPSRPYRRFGSMVAKRLVTRAAAALHAHPHRHPAHRGVVGGSTVSLLDKCNTPLVQQPSGGDCTAVRQFWEGEGAMFLYIS